MKNKYRLYRLVMALLPLVFIANCLSAQNIDINILKGINPQNPSSRYWRATSGTVDWVAGGVSFGTLGYGLFSGNKTIRNNGYELFISMAVNITLTELMKVGFNRTRPADKYPGEVFPSSPSHDKSFPSGHTSQAFAVATTLTMQYHKWYITLPAYLWAGSVGYSRMYLGKHYPGDVLGGAIVGVGSSCLGNLISRKLFSGKKK